MNRIASLETPDECMVLVGKGGGVGASANSLSASWLTAGGFKQVTRNGN